MCDAGLWSARRVITLIDGDASTQAKKQQKIFPFALVILYLTSSARRVFVKTGGAIASHIASSDWFSAYFVGRVVDVARSANLQSKLYNQILDKKWSMGSKRRRVVVASTAQNHYSQ